MTGVETNELREEEEEESMEKLFYLAFQTCGDDPSHVSSCVLPEHIASDNQESDTAEEKASNLHGTELDTLLPGVQLLDQVRFCIFLSHAFPELCRMQTSLCILYSCIEVFVLF